LISSAFISVPNKTNFLSFRPRAFLFFGLFWFWDGTQGSTNHQQVFYYELSS
jgi:hypothetical protein